MKLVQTRKGWVIRGKYFGNVKILNQLDIWLFVNLYQNSIVEQDWVKSWQSMSADRPYIHYITFRLYRETCVRGGGGSSYFKRCIPTPKSWRPSALRGPLRSTVRMHVSGFPARSRHQFWGFGTCAYIWEIGAKVDVNVMCVTYILGFVLSPVYVLIHSV